jgi:hypothetical protein
VVAAHLGWFLGRRGGGHGVRYDHRGHWKHHELKVELQRPDHTLESLKALVDGIFSDSTGCM